jgi:hypothetical protein
MDQKEIRYKGLGSCEHGTVTSGFIKTASFVTVDALSRENFVAMRYFVSQCVCVG